MATCDRCLLPLPPAWPDDLCKACQAVIDAGTLSAREASARDSQLLRPTIPRGPAREAPVTSRGPRKQLNEAAKAQTVSATYEPNALQARTIALTDIPLEARSRVYDGRIEQLWNRILQLPPGMAEQVEHGDLAEANRTRENITRKARLHGLKRMSGRRLLTGRSGTTLYFWLTPQEATDGVLHS